MSHAESTRGSEPVTDSGPDGESETENMYPYAVFDFHLHAFPLFFRDVFRGTADPNHHPFWQLFHGDTVEPSVLRETIEAMDASGIQKGLLCGNNRMVQKWVAEYPDRFLASFTPDLERPEQQKAVAQFEQEVEQGMWRALGELMLPYLGRPLNEPALDPYYAVCERHGIPVAYHSGLTGRNPHRQVSPYRFRVELGAPLLLQDVIERFPALKIVVMHMGWPFFEQALYMLYAYPENVYLDTGVVNWILAPSLFHKMLREAVETAGDRILFGSDQMIMPEKIQPALQPIVEADYLTEQEKRQILGDNARKLLGVLP